ncbi:hypothetical protein SAMN00767673_1167 [Rubrobacter radiotolerans DSM 5868]|nr:hypothetical protein SAMN00767673_1167 [Rubrobacter radiotolerans DSM 5868]
MFGFLRDDVVELADLLNAREDVMVCRERYKFAPEKVDPAAFTFERILDYEPRQDGETDTPREYHARLLDGKDPDKLRWIGDELPPGRERLLRQLDRQNPGAHFLIIYRSVTDVAGFAGDGRSVDECFEAAVKSWNRTVSGIREYFENTDEPNGLIVALPGSPEDEEGEAALLSHFLEVEPGDGVCFDLRERKPEPAARPMSEERTAYVDARKNHADEAWLLRRIERQREEPGLYKRSPGEARGRRRLAAATAALNAPDKDLVRLQMLDKDLKDRVKSVERTAERLGQTNLNLRAELAALQDSSSWRVARGLTSVLRRIRGGR